eukprot:UN07114
MALIRLLFIVTLLSSVLSQFHSTPTPVQPISSRPTAKPTHKIYPCDFIDERINGSNCGACISNSSCTWCTIDNSCHQTSSYDTSQCKDPKTQQMETISGPNHLFKCCETSTTFERCTTLYYVGCDWCIPSKTCFNSSINMDCEHGNKNNRKEIIYKDGICRTDTHKTIWDKIKDYYLQIPIVFRCILLSLSAICLVLLFICLFLCARSKINKRRLRKKYRKIQHEKHINSYP